MLLGPFCSGWRAGRPQEVTWVVILCFFWHTLPGGPASRAPPAQALVFAFFFALPLAFPFFGADAFQKPGSLRSFLRCDLRAPPRRQPARPRAPGIGGGVVVVVVCVGGPYQSQ